MKEISELTKNLNMTGNASEIATLEAKKTMVEATNALFTKLSVIYPSMHAQIAKNEAQTENYLGMMKKTWAKELFEEKITPDEILRGLKHCKMSSTGFLPSIGQFIKYCRESLNAAEANAGWLEFNNRLAGDKFKDLKTRETMKRLGIGGAAQFIVMNNDDSQLSKKIFCEVFDEVAREVESGQLVLVEQIAIENQENKTVAGYEQRKENIAKSKGYTEFKQMLNK